MLVLDGNTTQTGSVEIYVDLVRHLLATGGPGDKDVGTLQSNYMVIAALQPTWEIWRHPSHEQLSISSLNNAAKY